ncbi:SpoIID/LytB domain-containing protein [Neobacillus thermocopriae]|uniref:Uncharacterized protein n=1 Tax=Neobacillus thermocopriae TaxID=1215031 RepID=A0A6B3TM76_9BACI|nr:SpoIID/LytB domain-containing protein [Neobacillus thermocopriae]MED3623940.1 hypothetical protein [Neobacillus thermocopriae]MED3713865.1 hypothetical protein [Neobacillus thermocopriae]NEX77993.1 hypothetical protein [Neobacillus thermocopriae]
MQKLISVVLILMLLPIPLPLEKGNDQMKEPILKVKLVNFLGNKTEMKLKPSVNYKTSDSNIILQTGVTYIVKQKNGKLFLYKGEDLLNTYAIFKVQPMDNKGYIQINDRPYLGSFEFIVENGQYVRPINSVDMEDYLKGVVPIEMYPS